MNNFISNATKDLFTKKILLVSLLPLAIAALALGLLFWLFGGVLSGLVESLFLHIPYIGSWKWLQNSINAVGGVLLYSELLIIVSVMIVGIVADKVVIYINDQHYHNAKKGFGTLAKSIIVSLKQNIIYIILLIFLFPLFFIPIIGLIVHLLLWYILIKKPLFFDSVALYATKDEYKRLMKSDRLQTISLTLMSASLFFIPVIGVFIYVFQLVVFAHYNLSRLLKIRESEKALS